MSCYLISSKEAILLASLFHSDTYNVNCLLSPSKLDYIKDTASRLLTENLKSVSHRYPKDTYEVDSLTPFWPSTGNDWDKVDYLEAFLKSYTATELLKIIQHYEYQSCEHDGWIDSHAYKVVSSCLSIAIARLPDYNAASWGI